MPPPMLQAERSALQAALAKAGSSKLASFAIFALWLPVWSQAEQENQKFAEDEAGGKPTRADKIPPAERFPTVSWAGGRLEEHEEPRRDQGQAGEGREAELGVEADGARGRGQCTDGGAGHGPRGREGWKAKARGAACSGTRRTCRSHLTAEAVSRGARAGAGRQSGIREA
ncbi:unnamed protein product, partial [Symbiodinium sp. CCMP2456]